MIVMRASHSKAVVERTPPALVESVDVYGVDCVSCLRQREGERKKGHAKTAPNFVFWRETSFDVDVHLLHCCCPSLALFSLQLLSPSLSLSPAL